MMKKPTSKKMMPAKKAMMGSKMTATPMMKKGGSVKKYPDGGSIKKPDNAYWSTLNSDLGKKKSKNISDYINPPTVKTPMSNIKPTMRKGGKSMMRKGGKSC